MGLVEGDDGTGRSLARLRAPDRDDLARPCARGPDSEMDDQGDLPDRQDRSRHAALHALPGAGTLGDPFNLTRMVCAARCLAAPCDPLRPAFAADLLPRRVPV